MPDLVQLLAMLAAFVIYLLISGWVRHRQQKRERTKGIIDQWWGQGR